MTKKIIFGLLWLAFGGYAFGFAPPDQPTTAVLIQNLVTGNLAGINPAIIALFNIMGVLPAMYACVLFADGRGQKISAGFFVALSFGIGAFGLLPYFALRNPNPTFVGAKTRLIKVFDARWFGVLLTIIATVLVGYGLKEGNWADFWIQFKSNRFIHVMSLDFCLLCALFPWLLGDDMQRRGFENKRINLAARFLPLFGALLYLCLRPEIIIAEAEPKPEQNSALVSP